MSSFASSPLSRYFKGHMAMRPRITASKAIISKLQQKVSIACNLGDVQFLRRTQGLLGVLRGDRYEDIAQIVGVAVETIRLWINSFLAEGFRSLKLKKSKGRPPKLTKSQKKQLKQVIKRGPEEAGYGTGCWNSAIVQDFIQKTFKVFYSVHYIAQLLKSLGLTYQKARFVSAHLDPKSRNEWLKEKWPKILKLAKKRGAYLLFGDEASFPQWGSLGYTWAPAGEQPVVKTSGSRRGYKVFGLIDYFTGKLFHKGITGKFTSESYSDFLRGVLSETRKPLILIQDGARYHTSEDMQAFFYKQKERLTVFQMPAYSPDYNPIEILWKKIKGKGVHLKYFPTFESLTAKVDELMSEFAAKPSEVLKVFGFYTKKKDT